jgi:Sucrase/ferredoxin-like
MKDLIKGFLLPEKLNQSHTDPLDSENQLKTSNRTHPALFVAPIRNPTILICSHHSRDSRCGVLGPLLRDEFAKCLSSKNVPVEMEHFCHNRRITEAGPFRPEFPINIGLISHIGGHKWAGNVIIYIPSDWGTTWQSQHLTAGSLSKVAGMGVWYGRVEPKHVEGIVEETLFKGSVIKELFRGAIGHDGQMLRI